MTVTNESPPQLMRDIVINSIAKAAKKDKDVLFISADLGAKSLDDFRRKFPNQFIHAGISEQNMVDLASGLALSGKRVFLYAMAPFITARCYEQIKCVIASMGLPVTLISVGVGLGYDHATLTHFTPEDIACMRALNGIEVLTPSDAESTEVIIEKAIAEPKFRYLRLDRQAQPPIYDGNFRPNMAVGFSHIMKAKQLAIVCCGALMNKALAAREKLILQSIDVGIIDLFRVKPINGSELSAVLNSYNAILTLEEQLLDGGMGSAIAETLADYMILKPLKRLGMRDGFSVVNGDRDQLHDLYGISVFDVIKAANELLHR
ncbi:MAG: transketolase family protein [Rhodospirillales bacterium]|tara:strand:- start:9993 stop:10949 length:957 start_codon:yes stop_codon:yes gene_type:complete